MSIEKSFGKKLEGSDKGISRRKFLSILIGAGAGVAAMNYPSFEKAVREISNDEEDLKEEMNILVEKIKNQYGFDVSFENLERYIKPTRDSENIFISGKPLSSLEKRDAALQLFLEISVYPKEYFEHLGVKKIIFVNDLKTAKQHFMPEGIRDEVGGLVDAQDNIYINFSAGILGWFDSYGVERGIHHEFYHQADYFKDEDPESEFNAWKNLNHFKGLEYEDVPLDDGTFKKGGSIGNEGYVDLVKRRIKHSGFARMYGMTSVIEDKATVADALIVNYNKIMEQCVEDKVLAEKVKLIKAEYLKWTKGKMNDAFWEDFKNGKVKTDYWNK